MDEAEWTRVRAASARDPMETFARAAIEWAAGGRGQPLVTAAAEGLAAGLDSPSLRVLAGAPRAHADQEATELGPDVFEELELVVHERLSPPAVVVCARLRAERFLAGEIAPRRLADDLWRMYVSSGYEDELGVWSGIDDAYVTLESGLMAGRVSDVDAAVVEAARALVDGHAVERANGESPGPLRRVARRWHRRA